MTADSLQKQSQGPAGRLFQKGQSGNPGGRRPEVACGRLLLDEGATLVGMKESKRRAMETIDLEKRLRALEAETRAMASRPGPERPRSRLWNASHDRRLARLEQAKLEQERRPATKVFYVWRNAPAESTKAAIARTFPRGLPADARLVICSWQRRQAREPDHRGVA